MVAGGEGNLGVVGGQGEVGLGLVRGQGEGSLWGGRASRCEDLRVG